MINETRVGRDVGQALEETADRMDSKDMKWVAQAIMINRQTGGNLAEVLDQVSGTIRERGQIKRQVQALSCRGEAVGLRADGAAVRRGWLHHAHQPGLPAQVHSRACSATACSASPRSCWSSADCGCAKPPPSSSEEEICQPKF